VISNHVGAFGRRVNPVVLIEVRAPGDAFEQEWQERNPVLPGQDWEHLMKLAPVIRSHVGRTLQTRQQHGHVPLARTTEDLREIPFHLVGRQPPEAVVAPERDDENPHVAVKRPIQPAQPSRRRVARHAGVHDLETIAAPVEPPLEDRRVCLGFGKPEPGSQAVAEDDDARTRGGSRGDRLLGSRRNGRWLLADRAGVFLRAACAAERQDDQSQNAGDRSNESWNQRLSIILARPVTPRTKTVSAPLLVCLLVLLALGGAERLARDRALRAIPVRIHVNGTRAKSTVTRLIWAALTEAGTPTMAKTTGTAARILLPGGTEVPVRRHGPANVREQLEFIRLARREGARAVVVECMALDPTLQYVTEREMVRATIGVITNARLDHTEIMGPDVCSVASTLANTIPVRGVLVTGASEFAPLFRERAAALGTRVVVVDPGPHGPAVPGEGGRWLAEDSALALAVTRELGIDDAVAWRGFARAPQDPGAVRRGRAPLPSGEAAWLDATAANDPESLARLLEDFEPWHRGPAVGVAARPRILVYHHRADRVPRLECFAAHLPDIFSSDLVVVSGAHPPSTAWRALTRIRRPGTLLFVSTDGLAAWLAANASRAAVVFCGNTRGLDVPRLIEEATTRG